MLNIIENPSSTGFKARGDWHIDIDQHTPYKENGKRAKPWTNHKWKQVLYFLYKTLLHQNRSLSNSATGLKRDRICIYLQPFQVSITLLQKSIDLIESLFETKSSCTSVVSLFASTFVSTQVSRKFAVYLTCISNKDKRPLLAALWWSNLGNE